jgi:hypothetical protein
MIPPNQASQVNQSFNNNNNNNKNMNSETSQAYQNQD